MKSLGIFETKNHLSELCEQVATSGEPVMVTRHGKPLVCIVPVRAGERRGSVWDTVEESRAKYGNLTDDLELPLREIERNRPDPLDP